MSVNLRDVAVYAAVVIKPKVNLRQVVGYAMTLPAITPDWSVSAATSLLGALNKQYKTSFTAAMVVFESPTVLSNDPTGMNSSVVVHAKRISGYQGTKVQKYNRWPLAKAFEGKTIVDLPNLGATVSASVPAIAAQYGLALTADDFVDGPIDPDATQLTLTAKSTSLYYVPGSTITLGS